ncbi:MAG: aminopeptidase [Gemmatimonadetes bacterium]|nr:aminopeptidase [Gemmatimonadota bacterium]
MPFSATRAVLAPVLLATAAACAANPSANGPIPDPAPPVVQGVSRELALYRSARVSEVSYGLALDVTARDTAAGSVAIGFRRAAGAGDLVLDFRGRSLARVVANGRGVPDARWADGHLAVPAAYLLTGRNRVQIDFSAGIAAAGTSIIRYDDAADGATYLYTLLVPADANQLFPCFDQPDLKARFRTTITAPATWTVLSNGPLDRRDTVASGTRWSFAETEPIPTYLAAFAAGPWTTWRSAPAGERPITLYARASRRAEVDADSIIRANRDAVKWLEGYSGVRFPFAKFDVLLAPAFPFGGMEHVGAVFYNEEQFVFREPPTFNQRLSRDATIYHEVAHQWFGDLVTMRWFDDLWLKEGFATYVAAMVQADLDPRSGAWKTFYLRNKPLAYGVDATSGTTPVWQELPNLDLAKSNYGPIVYNKAPGVLKQLDYLVGDTAFRAGLAGYLRAHPYGSATWRDLLAAVEQASGVPLKGFGQQYILRAGMPRVETRLDTAGGAIRSLSLVQSPARALPGDRGGWWPGRVRVRLAYHDRPDVVVPVTFDSDTTVVAQAAGLPVPDYVFPNDGDYGYGLFLLDSTSAAYVLGHVGQERDDLRRAMLWGALWDLVREGRLPPAAFLDAAHRELPGEGDEQIAGAVLGRAQTALALYLPPEALERQTPAWERLLLARSDDARLGYGMRKAALDAYIGLARTPAALGTLRDLLAGRRRFDGQPVKPPTRWAAVTTLLARGVPDADALLAAERARDTTPDAARRAFVAGAAVPTAAAKAAYFRRYLDDPGLNEEWVTASLGAFDDPEQAALTLPYLRPALEKLEWIRDNRRIFFLGRWVNAFVGGQASSEALRTVDAFLAAHPELPLDIRRKVLQARDELERTAAIRAAP